MHHGSEFTVVLVAIAALGLGAATRALLRGTAIPYTVALLIVGLGLGFTLPSGHSEHAGLAAHVLEAAASITPDLIIFVFLPALVFESAFALDAYGFRKNLGPVLVLAVFGLLASAGLTAVMMVGLTGSSWQWPLPVGLVFGALISATDPVAVVAILRELGAPKRLAMLIEGESLMNDGTAIVLFNVLIGALAVGAGQIEVGYAALDFVRVVAGGVGVGLVLGAATTAWLSRTFNDPLVEITLTLVMAYAAMAIAEGMLHVSGVMALVTAGLWMSSVGRPRISPELQHFLHQFWQMLAYVANTLIFILVGVLVARQFSAVTATDLLVVLAAYVGIVVIRFAVTFALLPAMNRVGDPISSGQATVMSWGGLRGAVSLALALVVCQHPEVPPELQRQVLLLTAGIAFLTIVVNGSTSARLLAYFRFDRPPLGVQLAQAQTQARVLADVQARIGELSADLKTVDWSEVERELDDKRNSVQSSMDSARDALLRADAVERVAGLYEQVLSIERQAYWSLFGQGIIGARCLRVLSRELDVQQDHLGRGHIAPPPSRLPSNEDWMARGARLLRQARVRLGRASFEHLALMYDLARATSHAATRVLAYIDELEEEPEGREALVDAYRGYRMQGRERMEDLRTNLPEMTQALETRLARRIELNLERDDYNRLAHDGVIEEQAAHALLEEVEAEMKRLLLRPTEVALPETADLCRRAPLFAGLDAAGLDELAELTEERVFSSGEVLFRQGDRGDSMFVIARGAVHVVIEHPDGHEEVVDVLGGGDILGEMALLTGQPRTATIRTATTVTAGEVKRESFERLMEGQPHLREGVWRAFMQRQLDNHLRARADLPSLPRGQLLAWTEGVAVQRLRDGASCDLQGARYVFVVDGDCSLAGSPLKGPALVEVAHVAGTLTALGDAAVALLGPLPAWSIQARDTQSRSSKIA